MNNFYYIIGCYLIFFSILGSFYLVNLYRHRRLHRSYFAIALSSRQAASKKSCKNKSDKSATKVIDDKIL